MYVGQNYRPKIDVISYMILSLLIEGVLDGSCLKYKFNLTDKTFYRYVSFIKSLLMDYGFYYIDIEYDRKAKMYICRSRCKFKSSNYSS